MKAWSVSAETYKVSFEELSRIMRINAQSKKTYGTNNDRDFEAYY